MNRNRGPPQSYGMGNVIPASGVTPVHTIDGGTIRFLGHQHFLITLDVIAQTGSDVTTLVDIPFAHELTTLTVKHVDGSNADSTASETITFKHRYSGNFWFSIWKIVAGTSTDVYGKFTDAFMLPGQYQIISNTTNEHKLHITMEVVIMES